VDPISMTASAAEHAVGHADNLPADNQLQAIAWLRQAHHGPRPLILPTAWDALSALTFQAVGFEAVGTGSQGVAATHGLPDGERITLAEMNAAISRIVASVTVPVSADIEGGYGRDPAAVYRNIQALVSTGIAGCNFEDAIAGEAAGGLYPITEQLDRIRAARSAADDLGLPIVLNAVIDSYLVERSNGAQLSTALERGPAYVTAGADCLYVPGMTRLEDITAFAAAVASPVNLLVRPGLPPLSKLAELGIKRLTFGSGLLRSVTKRLMLTAAALRDGDFEPFFADFWPNPDFCAITDRTARTMG
jgi:2-methylisocitrate lyase-like PEP mutase family enzyme